MARHVKDVEAAHGSDGAVFSVKVSLIRTTSDPGRTPNGCVSAIPASHAPHTSWQTWVAFRTRVIKYEVSAIGTVCPSRLFVRVAALSLRPQRLILLRHTTWLFPRETTSGAETCPNEKDTQT